MRDILITGGTGSFGRAFVRNLTRANLPSSWHRIIIYSRGEHAQEDMAREFCGDPRLRFFIGDVRDKDRLEMAMRDVDTVVHAAALKIVPIAEYNPTECVATNVTGTENVVKAALRSGVRRALLLSTDKAVNPINLYGSTKLAAEKIFCASNSLAAGRCAFSVVRYGNVVGSRGSVVPLFKKLASEGKTLPITHPDMTRFWITMDQATALVHQSLWKMEGGEIAIPKIPSMKIVNLAKMIAPRIGIEIVGIRPGEKIHECLITADEARMTTDEGDCYIIHTREKHPDSGPMVPDGFSYASNTNDKWLTDEEMEKLI